MQAIPFKSAREASMVPFVMMGVVAVIGFLCVSHAIPEMLERKPARFSSPRKTTQPASET